MTHVILNDPLPRVPTNPYDTTAWLDYLADVERPSLAIDQLLENDWLAAKGLIEYALTSHIRLSRAATQAREHLAKPDLSLVLHAFWEGLLCAADPTPQTHPHDEPF